MSCVLCAVGSVLYVVRSVCCVVNCVLCVVCCVLCAVPCVLCVVWCGFYVLCVVCCLLWSGCCVCCVFCVLRACMGSAESTRYNFSATCARPSHEQIHRRIRKQKVQTQNDSVMLGQRDLQKQSWGRGFGSNLRAQQFSVQKRY